MYFQLTILCPLDRHSMCRCDLSCVYLPHEYRPTLGGSVNGSPVYPNPLKSRSSVSERVSALYISPVLFFCEQPSKAPNSPRNVFLRRSRVSPRVPTHLWGFGGSLPQSPHSTALTRRTFVRGHAIALYFTTLPFALLRCLKPLARIPLCILLSLPPSPPCLTYPEQ